MHKLTRIGDNNLPSIFHLQKQFDLEAVRRKIKEDYLKISSKPQEAKEAVVYKWSEAINHLLNLDVKLCLMALKILGDIYLEFDDYEKAKNIFLYHKFLVYNLELLDEYMLSFEALGGAYKFLYNYEKAIKCYKKQIEVAWVLNKKHAELRALDNIGMQYFYLNDKSKAKYYHNRFLKGRVEKDESSIKTHVTGIFRDKNFNLFDDNKYKKIHRTHSELKSKLEEVLELIEDKRNRSSNKLDFIKMHENVQNSFISDVDISFKISKYY
jgi:tetratricopeptide (TPR) repeat protein